MHPTDAVAITKLAQAGRSSTLAAPFNLASSNSNNNNASGTSTPSKEKESRRSHLSLHHHHHHHHHHHKHNRDRDRDRDRGAEAVERPQQPSRVLSRREKFYGGDDKEVKSAVLPRGPSLGEQLLARGAAGGAGAGPYVSGRDLSGGITAAGAGGVMMGGGSGIGIGNLGGGGGAGSVSGGSVGGGSIKELNKDSAVVVSPSVVAEVEGAVVMANGRVVRPEDVVRERERQKRREGQLRSALQTLSEQSMATTRRLDDTYYSILEKVSGLHNIIDDLQELSTLTRRLGDEFASDADELVDEVNNSVDSIGDFESQARLLEEFESRIQAGKEKAARLNERLDAAKKRVDERERLEEEWRASVSRRLRIFWSILGAVAALMLVAFIIHSIRTGRQQDAIAPRVPISRGNRSINFENVKVPPPVREILESVQSSSSSSTSAALSSAPTSKATKEDQRLHVFDEL